MKWPLVLVCPYLHSVEIHIFIVMPSSFPLYPLLLNKEALYFTSLYFFSLSPCGLSFSSSINLFALAHLADTVNSRCFSTPAVTLRPGCTIRSSLLANTQSGRETKAVCSVFVLCAAHFYHFISLHPQAHFKQKGVICLSSSSSLFSSLSTVRFQRGT